MFWHCWCKQFCRWLILCEPGFRCFTSLTLCILVKSDDILEGEEINLVQTEVKDMMFGCNSNLYWSVLMEVCMTFHLGTCSFYTNSYEMRTCTDMNSTKLSSVILFFFCLLVFECICGFELSSLIQGKWGTRSASSAYQASVLFIVGRGNIMEHTMQQGDT